MTASKQQESMDRVAGYVDQEIDEAAAAAMKHDMEHSAELKAEVKTQQQIKAALQQHSQRLHAPPRLRAQIRRELDRIGSELGFWAQIKQLLLWQPAPTFAAALLLIVMSSMITYFSASSVDKPTSAMQQILAQGFLEGELACEDCEIQKSLGETPVHQENHRPAIKTADGKIFGILPNGQGADLIKQAGPSRKIRVEGELSDIVRYVRVSNFSIQ